MNPTQPLTKSHLTVCKWYYFSNFFCIEGAPTAETKQTAKRLIPTTVIYGLFRLRVRSRWLDFVKVFLCVFMDRDKVEIHKAIERG